MRQLGIGTAAYLSDNNDQIFSSTAAEPWPATLQAKYVTTWKAFRSSFDKRPEGSDAIPANQPVSYGINVNILTQTSGGPTDFDGNVTKITSTSSLIYMAPTVDPAQAKVAFVANTGGTNASLPMPGAPTTRRGTHGNRAQINALYMDAHVAALNYRDYATTTGDEGQRRWMPIPPTTP